MVGCAIREDITNHTVIVFTGKQGLGKTTWLMNLVPQQLSDYRYSGTIKPGNRDSVIYMAESMLINLDELESLNKSELGDLKEMITKSHIRTRRAYGRNVEKYTRHASFCGSVNKTQFLTDTTGSRRFLCFESVSIDYRQTVNYDMVYAQALQLLNSGFKYWFDDVEIAKITEKNERYQVVTVEEDLLLKYFIQVETAVEGAFYTPTRMAEIISARAKMSVSNATIQNLGRALSKHNFKHIKKNGVYGYLAKEIKP
jgi:predicted P-loop ATPase